MGQNLTYNFASIWLADSVSGDFQTEFYSLKNYNFLDFNFETFKVQFQNSTGESKILD